MTNYRYLLFIVFAGLLMTTGCSFKECIFGKSKSMKVLCLASADTKIQGLTYIDPKALSAYRSMGYELELDYYQNVDYQRLCQYPIVVGMIPELHAGTKPIDKKLGEEIKQYVADGGGFVLIPGPSYYGVEDFTVQLNPWLQTLGAELLNELPRDFVNQRELVRVLAYRYLKTANFADHPIMENIDEIYLPLDYSNSFVRTHTMKVSDDWQILVKGEKTCSTHPYRELRAGNPAPGAYDSAPPFLAVRDYGKGKLALFTTASRYMIFDAYHWAHGDGFVMEKGNCRKLMKNLFAYLASGNTELLKTVTHPKPQDKKSSEKTIKSNVPICVRKKEWLQYVLDNFCPGGSGIKYYIDCGAMSDIPYTSERGYGYIDIPYTNWLIRWPWSEIFHATAANSRGFDIKNLHYRFDKLDPGKTYELGVMVWGYQDEGSRPVTIRLGKNGTIKSTIDLPRFSQQQGPLFKVLDVPERAIVEGSLLTEFSIGTGGMGRFSSICELWLFESGKSDMTPEQIQGRFESSSALRKELITPVKAFSGLIGARSNYTDGRATVSSLAATAQRAGLSFLVFTDDATKLDAVKLKKLKADCKNVSSKDFLAIPGFSFSAEYADREYNPCEPQTWGSIDSYVFQNIKKLPPEAALKNPHTLYWKFFGGEFGGGKRAAPTILHPGTNAISPFFQRFWRGLNLMTFDEGQRTVDDSRRLYVDLLSSGYGPYPRVSGIYRTASDISRAAKGWKTYIMARDLECMPLYHYSSLVSNGPEIVQYVYSFDYMREVEGGGGILVRDKCWLLGHFKARSSLPIKNVTLYSGKTPIRKWYPNKTTFSVCEPLLMARQHELWLKVTDSAGKEAYSGRFLVQDHKFMVGMCADNQNSICSLTKVPTKYERDERDLYLQHSYWHTGEAAGQLGVLRNTRNLVPRIIESGIIQVVKHFLPMPKLWFADGTVEDHTTGEMRIVKAAKDFNLIDYTFDAPKCRTKSKVRLTSFRPAVHGGTAVLIEADLEAKQDIKLKPGDNSLRLLSLAMMPPLAPIWKYTFDSLKSGTLSTGKFSDIPEGQSIQDVLRPDGGIMFWPCEVGSILIFPLTSTQPYRLKFDNFKGVWNGREHLELYSMNSDSLKKGEHRKLKLLVILYAGKISSSDDLAELKKAYIDVAAYLPELTKGKLLSSNYVAEISAENGSVVGEFSLDEKRDPLPVIVKGINPNWSCAKIQDGKITILNTDNDILRTVIDPNENTQKIFIGNILQSDHPEVILEWGQVYAGGIRVHMHNPTAQQLTFKVKTNPDSPGIPSVDSIVTLNAGTSTWGWIKEGLMIFENADLQVDACRKQLDSLEISAHGLGPIRYSGPAKKVQVNGKNLPVKDVQGVKVVENGKTKIKKIVFVK